MWLFSFTILILQFIHIVTYNQEFIPFYLWVVFHCIDKLMHISVVSSLGLYQIKLSWMFLCESLYGHGHFSWKIPNGRVTESSDGCTLNFWKKPLNCFPKWLYDFILCWHQQCISGPVVTYSRQYLVCSIFLILAIPIDVYYGFNMPSPMTNYFKHLFMYLHAIHVSSSVSIQIFCTSFLSCLYYYH